MAIYTKTIVTIIVCLIVFLPGLIEYLFANISPIRQFYSIWTEYWIISVTQAPVGYGDSSPDTLFGQISLLTSCFTGLILLGLTTSVSSNNLNMNLKECNLYSELLYTRGKRRYIHQAGTLIQRWWKLMRMRAAKKRQSEVIIGFYCFLGEYKKVIIECQRLRDHRFERQIVAFESFTETVFRPLTDYLIPLRDAYGTVSPTQAQDLVRCQYRMLTRILTIYEKAPKSPRLANRVLKKSVKISPRQMRRNLPAKRNSIACHRRKQNVSSQGLAIARGVACRNVKGRLVGSVAVSVKVAQCDRKEGEEEHTEA